MLPGRALARSFALVGVAGVISAGLATGTALAAGTVTVTSPSPARAANTHTGSVTFATSDPFAPSPPAAAPTVTLSRNGVGSDKLTSTGVQVASLGGAVSASFDFTFANPGAYDATITNGVVTDTCSACFTVVGGTPSATSVSPNLLGLGGSMQQFQITGTNFAKGPYDGSAAGGTVQFVRSISQEIDTNAVFGPVVNGSNPAPVAPTTTTIVGRLQLSGTDTTGYDDDVVVTNTDGHAAVCPACLHIVPQPVISSIALTGPGGAAIGQNAQNQQLVITGTNFAPDSTVTIAPPAQNVGAITFVPPVVVKGDGTQITLNGVNTTTVTSGGIGSAHPWALSVSSSTLHNSSAASPLTVNPEPTASSITYEGGSSDVGQGATSRTVTVAGTNIVAGTHIVFANLPGTIVQSNEVADATAQTVSVQLDVPQNATVTTYDVTLVNPDGGTSTTCATAPSGVPPTSSPCPLTVAAGPSISSISPNTVTGPYTGQVVVTGSNFHPGAGKVLVTIAPASGQAYLSNFVGTAAGSGSAMTITIPPGQIAVPASARLSDANVTVSNVNDGGTKTVTGIFHIVNSSLTGIDPAFSFNDTKLTGVQVTGTNFDPTATVLLRRSGLADIPGTNTNVALDGSSLTADFDLRNVGPGDYQVIVTNPGNASHPGPAANPSVVFSVFAQDPTTTEVTPTALGGGASQVPVTVTGTNFYPGSVVSFDNPAITLVQNSAPVIDQTRTHITQLVNVASNAGAGSAAATVTNSAGIQSNTQNIAIHAAPTVVGVTPGKHSPDPFQLSVAGSGFLTDATLQFDNAGVHATNVQVVDPTTITAHLTFDTGTVPGDAPVDVAVTVINPDHGRATSPDGNGLTLDPEPRITSVVPSSIPAGKSTDIKVLGANFLNNTATPLLAAGGSGITVSNVQFVTADEIDATLTVAGAAARGARTLTVDNGEGGTATRDVAVYVVPGAPQAPAASAPVVTPGDSSLSVAWSSPADDGGSAVTGYTVTLTQHGTANSTSHSLGSSATSDSFTGLANGTLYDVAVVAANGAGNGPALTGSGTPRTVPDAPGSFSVSPLNGELDLSWVAPANGGSPITSYTATLTPHAGGSPVSHPLASAATSDAFTGLTNGTLYDVSVVAHNAAGNGAAVSGSGTPRTTPTAPTSLVLAPGNGTLSVSWAAPASNGGNAIDNYTVSVVPHSGGTPTSFDTADASTTSHNFTGLANGTLYDVSVVAHNAAGNGAAVSGAGTPRTTPSVPTALVVAPGDGTLSVSWSAPASDGGNAVDKYTVSVAPHSGGTTTTFDTADGATRSHDFGSLVNGTLYDVSVVAHNAAGNSAAASGSGTPRAIPGAPQSVAVSAGDALLSVSWTAPAADGGDAVKSYTVSATPHSGGTATTFTTADASTLSHAFSGLTNGTLYDVSVVANNAAGPSAATSGSGTPKFVSTLSVADSAGHIVDGASITLSGVLTRSDRSGVAGVAVTLFRTLDGKSAAPFLSVTTSPTGAWSARFAPVSNATYFASYAGSGSTTNATSRSVRTTVAPKITISSPRNKSTSSAAKALKVSGRVAPNKAGRAVSLYYVTKTGRLVRLATAKVTAKSTYVLTTRLKRGTWRLVVVISASPGNTLSRSAVLTVKRT